MRTPYPPYICTALSTTRCAISVHHHFATDGHVVALAARRINLRDAAVREQEDVLLLLVPDDACAAGVEGCHDLGLTGAQRGGPEIVSTFELSQIVERLTILAEQRAAH